MQAQDVRVAEYFQIVVSDGQVTQVVPTMTSGVSGGTRWFLLRVGVDREGETETGYHVCDLTRSQQQKVAAYLGENPADLKKMGEDWLDWYANEEYEANHQLYSRERLVTKF